MTDRELNIALREMARSAGLCDQWYSGWSDDDTIDDCLDRAVRGFDFVHGKDFPSLDFIRKNFKEEDLHRHNIFLDEKVEIDSAENGYYVFLGDCEVSMDVNGLKAVTVYCKHNSKVDVSAYNGAKVFVRYYDKSFGRCDSDKWSVIKQYKR